jgi:hypothetical protein
VSFMDRIKANPLPLFKLLVLPMGLVAFIAMAIEGTSAQDKGCDGNPVLGRIKLDCCGEAEEHQLKPEQISRGPPDTGANNLQPYLSTAPPSGREQRYPEGLLRWRRQPRLHRGLA